MQSDHLCEYCTHNRCGKCRTNGDYSGFIGIVVLNSTEVKQIKDKIISLTERLESHGHSYECDYGDYNEIIDDLRKLSV